MTDRLFIADPVQFRCAPTDSKKNRGQVIGFGRPCRACGRKPRYSYRPNPVALQQEERIREFLWRRFGDDAPHFGDDDVRVEITFRPRDDAMDVAVEHVRSRPKGFSGRRRDIANLSEALLDALQGPVIANDNQLAELVIRREL